ncbi:MAG: guanine deaminase [Phycisphaerales bacterium]|jgi:guanine deaminase
MRLGGTLMLPGPGRSVRLARGVVTLEGGRVLSVVETEELGGLDLGREGAVICPGFIDTHLHLPQFDSIGIDGLELLTWLDRVIFPAECRWEDTDYAGAMTERVLDQLVSFGTTSFAAYATVHHEAAKQAQQIIADRGHRALVGQVLMDRNAPTELTRPAKQLIAEAPRFAPIGRTEPTVTPRFAISCSDELLQAAGELTLKTGWAMQTHLSETVPELEFISELYDGTPYVEVYERAGLLGPRSIMAHGVWLKPEELATLKKTKSIIAHCPTANLFLTAGSHDRLGVREAGVLASLGSDCAGGPDRSMVRVARAMIETAKNRAADPATASEAWWQITAGNAEVLGWSQTGRLEAGCEADLLVIEPNIRWSDTPDPLGTLLYGWDDRWLSRAVVNGAVVYEA